MCKGDLARFLVSRIGPASLLQRQGRKQPAVYSRKFSSRFDRRRPLVKLYLTGFETRKSKVRRPATHATGIIFQAAVEKCVRLSRVKVPWNKKMIGAVRIRVNSQNSDCSNLPKLSSNLEAELKQ
jgi:hypothetical protein